MTQFVMYSDSFSTGWELDGQGRQQAVRHAHFLGSGQSVQLDLGSFAPGGESAGLGINVGGQVVGWAEDLVQGAMVRRPFLFTDADGLQAIELPQATEGWATGIATFGHYAAGTMRRPDGSLQAWYVDLFPSLGTAFPLDTPAGWESEALVMRNDHGGSPLLVGGLVRDPAGREFAAYWNPGAGVTILSTPGTGDARLTGFSNSHSWANACGSYLDGAGNEQGFVLQLDDPVNSFVTLPSLGGSWTRPAAVAYDSVYGASEDSLGQSRAFQYRLDTQVMEDLNDRASTSPGQVLTAVTSTGFGAIFSFDLEIAGASHGAYARTVNSGIWPIQAGAPANLSLDSGPGDSLVAFVYGFTGGSTSVLGIPGLFLDIANPQIVSIGLTDPTGSYTQPVPIPAAAAGLTVLIQAVMPTGLVTTSVDTVTFE